VACETVKLTYIPIYVFFPRVAVRKDLGSWPPLTGLRDDTQTHHILSDSSGEVIGPTQRPLNDNTQHSQETDIHDPRGIRTHNPSKRAATAPRLRPRGQCDRFPSTLRFAKWHLLFKFPTKITNTLLTPMRATCTVHFILVNFDRYNNTSRGLQFTKPLIL